MVRSSALSLIARYNLSGILIHSTINLYYLTGLHLSRGYLLLTPHKSILWVDPRYREAVQPLSSDIEICCHSSLAETHRAVGEMLDKLNGQFGFDASTMTVRGVSHDFIPYINREACSCSRSFLSITEAKTNWRDSCYRGGVSLM